MTLTPPIPPPPAGRIKFISTSARAIATGVTNALLHGKRFGIVRVQPRGGDLEKVNALVEAGKLRPIIEKVFPLEQVGEAHRKSETGHVRGKLVIKIAEEASVGVRKLSVHELQSHDKPEAY